LNAFARIRPVGVPDFVLAQRAGLQLELPLSRLWRSDLVQPRSEKDKPMNTAEIKDMVRARYGEIAAGTAAGCCAPAQPAGRGAAPAESAKAAMMGYSPEELAAVPAGANLGLGCGNPQAIASLHPGETVVDLGSGAGFDCLLAARQVGPTGRVIGVDMTHEMLKKARENAATTGAANVEFRLGEIEHLPIADDTADAIRSNCVVNLVPDKAQVFREAFRVLKPGGRLAISDVVNILPLGADMAGDGALLCGCIAGAAPVARIEAWLREAGFSDIRIAVKPESRDLVASWAPGRGIEDHVAAATIEGRKPGGRSAIV
jgi:SAM-dependent methyltransferase